MAVARQRFFGLQPPRRRFGEGLSARMRLIYGLFALNGCLLLSLLTGLPFAVVELFTTPKATAASFAPSKVDIAHAAGQAQALRETVFLQVELLVKPEPDVDLLNVREEYLVAHYGSAMKHGFRRTWTIAEPVQDGQGRFRRGPDLKYEISAATRQWLPEERLGGWAMIVDSNDTLGLPPPTVFNTALKAEGPAVTLALGHESLLEHGIYLYRIDYKVRGALMLERAKGREGFLLTALRPMTLPVRHVGVTVAMPDNVAPENGVLGALLLYRIGDASGTILRPSERRQFQSRAAEGINGEQVGVLYSVASDLSGAEALQIQAAWVPAKVERAL